MRNKLLIIILVVTIVFIAFSLYSFGREPAFEGEKGILSKLEQVLKNQQYIIERLEDIRKELDIIRIRATRR